MSPKSPDTSVIIFYLRLRSCVQKKTKQLYWLFGR